MKRDYLLFLRDIVERIERIERFIEGMDFEAFRTDDKTVSACIREIEVICEAVKHLPSFITERFDTLPWSLMAKMRDKLIHWYFDIDEEIVYKVAADKLPRIKTEIQAIIQELTRK